MNLFKCIRCKKEKPREMFGEKYIIFGPDGSSSKKARQLYCLDCTGRPIKKKPGISMPPKDKTKKYIIRACQNCGEDYIRPSSAKYCVLCRTETQRLERKK